MDNDTKHVLVILGFVACFGAGYFTCKTENRDSLKVGEKLSVFNTIENKLENKTDFELSDEKEAIKNAVNGYYQTDDKYFEYSFESDEDDKKEQSSNKEKESKLVIKGIHNLCDGKRHECGDLLLAALEVLDGERVQRDLLDTDVQTPL